MKIIQVAIELPNIGDFRTLRFSITFRPFTFMIIRCDIGAILPYKAFFM